MDAILSLEGNVMRKQINFVSRQQMKQAMEYEFDSNLAIISISDTKVEMEEMNSLLSNSQCDYLCLWFADSEESDGITDEQAKYILSFINHKNDFMIHCFAGVSRSGAVAKFINEYYEHGHMWLEDYQGHNKRVYNKLMAAAGLSLAAYYEELEKQERRGYFPAYK